MKLLIVNFHYFREETFTSGIYPVSETAFANQVNELAKEYTFISQEELAQCIITQQYKSGNYCLITFDDGLKEQMNAFHWLQQHRIPAVFYVPTKPLMDHIILDVHKLHLIRAQKSDEVLLALLRSLPGYEYGDQDATAAAGQYKYDSAEARELKYQLNFKLSLSLKSDFINTEFVKLHPNEAAFSKEFYMDTDDLKVLARAGMLGSHGHAHIPLAQSEIAIEDIHRSIQYLQDTTGHPILSFSYPYGSTAAVNEHTAELLTQTTVKFALTMWRGLNNFAEPFHPMLLFRVDTNDAPGGKNQSTLYRIQA